MSHAAPPTDRQLRFLRSLASRTATTFAQPNTRREASREIDRLLALTRSVKNPSERSPADEEAKLAYATAVHEDEVSGYGSSATWRSRPGGGGTNGREPDRAPVTLLTYTAGSAQRLLSAVRRGAHVHLVDEPANGEGERYAVEQLDAGEGVGPLRSLITDYAAQARELQEIPMASRALAKKLGG